MSVVTIFAPAKLNLFLAVTGRRTDGFHDLISVVAPLDFGDTLRAEPAEGFSLACDDPDVPCDETNLVLRAAAVFALAAGAAAGTTNASDRSTAAKFFLEKRVPMGAGLGGGSSDAVAALRALNLLSGDRLGPAALAAAAAQLGSDCPLFLQDGPVVVRGRGERVEPLPAPVAGRLRGRRVLLFKPAFGISTPWAYARLAALAGGSAAGGVYLPPVEAEARLAAWLGEAGAPAETLLFNNMEPPAFAKFLALPTLLEELRARFGLAARMSGSGSACFALLGDDAPVGAITDAIRAAWGDSALVVAARLEWSRPG
ncbi:MAG: 4-(cytidine 5'-diphospho)-2-C-methyl-D-erythritol kinase [Verrucomicrobia bacterium]|nr:4-(cytidine 5'-diphospho)-2-C-methyl-D-erythritol kinase [Verrucomicrobiota bacterium]